MLSVSYFVLFVFIVVFSGNKQVIVSLTEAVVWVGLGYTTPVAALPLCGANHKSASPRLSGVVNLLDNLIG